MEGFRAGALFQSRTPGPSLASPMNSMPASSRVVRMSFRLAVVALLRPSSVSILLIVLTLTDECSANAVTLQLRAARAIRI